MTDVRLGYVICSNMLNFVRSRRVSIVVLGTPCQDEQERHSRYSFLQINRLWFSSSNPFDRSKLKVRQIQNIVMGRGTIRRNHTKRYKTPGQSVGVLGQNLIPRQRFLVPLLNTPQRKILSPYKSQRIDPHLILSPVAVFGCLNRGPRQLLLVFGVDAVQDLVA